VAGEVQGWVGVQKTEEGKENSTNEKVPPKLRAQGEEKRGKRTTGKVVKNNHELDQGKKATMVKEGKRGGGGKNKKHFRVKGKTRTTRGRGGIEKIVLGASNGVVLKKEVWKQKGKGGGGGSVKNYSNQYKGTEGHKNPPHKKVH